MRRRIASLILAVLMIAGCFSLAGCKKGGGGANWPVNVSGVEVKQAPMRVVCLSRNFTEIACQMGYSSQLVGRAYDCDYYQVAALTPCGTSESPSIDAIKGLHPDLIITDSTTPEGTFDVLSSTDISQTDILVLDDAGSRTEFMTLYEKIGSIFGGAQTGKETGVNLANSILIELDDIARLTSKEEQISVCVILDDNATQCATGDTLTEMLINMAGGFNAATDGTGKNFNVSDIGKSDPEIILCPSTGLSSMYAKRDLQEVPAMQNQRLYAFDVSLLDIQCYDMIEVVWKMAHILHPDLITNDVMPEEFIDNSVPDPHFWDSDEAFKEYEEKQNAASSEQE